MIIQIHNQPVPHEKPCTRSRCSPCNAKLLCKPDTYQKISQRHNQIQYGAELMPVHSSLNLYSQILNQRDCNGTDQQKRNCVRLAVFFPRPYQNKISSQDTETSSIYARIRNCIRPTLASSSVSSFSFFPSLTILFTLGRKTDETAVEKFTKY